ncbi:DUF305 domain-containing protein [Sphaerisporangium fuscum]|uniref:DUF305 domain-containing protein n=1 Tax=Sphaerisporangium fuscum TaxID=2835868 RepID=UPI001BDD28CE|nr:DUF305 domain-containing protein [Sphaerisporangium fuscum]
MKRFVLATAGLAVAGLLATACGGQDAAAGHDAPAMPSMSSSPTGSAPSSPTGTSAGHNDQDAMFATMMIPHHRQAVEMAEPAAKRASSAEVKRLAEQIMAAQEPEIKTMSGWLSRWGLQVPKGDMPSMHHGMEGMMSDDDMKNLEGLSGRAFDKAFLEMMIKHHEGAVTMAEQERSAGAYAPAKEMADAIVAGQTSEITRMKQLLRAG